MLGNRHAYQTSVMYGKMAIGECVCKAGSPGVLKAFVTGNKRDLIQ